MTTKELMKLLPNRTAYSIRWKNAALGIFQTADTKQRMLNTRNSNSLVYGVGINDLVDDPNYVTQAKDSSGHINWRCPFYSKWTRMLLRCYGSNDVAYKDCTVSEEWHHFSAFKSWMEKQSWEGKQLDKDILVPGNKVYTEDCCLFVTHELNTLMHKNETRRGEFPMGVSSHPSTDKYVARINKWGKGHYLGSFDLVEEASTVYNEHKREHLLEVIDAITEDDTSDVVRTKAALLHHLELV